MKVACSHPYSVHKATEASECPPSGQVLQAGAVYCDSTHLESTHLHGHSSVEWDQQDYESNSSQD